MMYLLSLDKKEGFKGGDYCVPKFVVDTNEFNKHCQREYCRQMLYQLNNEVERTKKSLAQAKEKADELKIASLKIKLEELETQRINLKDLTVATIMTFELDTKLLTDDELKKLSDEKRTNYNSKITEAADLVPLWLGRTNDIIAMTYVCVMFNLRLMPAMTGFKDVYNDTVNYAMRYHTEEKTSEAQVKDFRSLKTDCEVMLNTIFEVSDNPIYKKYKVSKLPTYVVNDYVTATKGVYKVTKSGGIKLNPLKEDVAKRQLVLAFLHWQGCADTEKVEPLVTLETLGDLSF